METVTIQLPDDVYHDLEELAKLTSRAPGDLIREALELYRVQKRPAKKTHSVLDIPPVSVGAILKPWSSRSELLEDFFDRD